MSRRRKDGDRHEYRCVFVEYLDEQTEDIKIRLSRSGWTFLRIVEVATMTGRLLYLLFQRRITDEINKRALRRFKEEGRRMASRYQPLPVFDKADPYLAWYLG